MLFDHVVVVLLGDKGEIQIAEIVVDSATAGKTASKAPAVGFQGRDVTFFPGILVLADDDCVLILPEIEDDLICCDMIEQPVFQGKIFVWIGAVACYYS